MSGLHSIINRLQIAKQIPIFSKLNWFELQRIARKATLQEYKKGEMIRRQGDPADFFYCLVSGRVLAYTLDKYHFKDNVEFIHRGMHFGVISVFTGEAHSMNFEAINDSVVLKIGKDDFHAILKVVPSLAIEFSQSLSRRVRSHVSGRKTIFESTIISIYSPNVGTGSSTYAINLALSLAQETKKKAILLNIHLRNSGQGHSQSASDASPVWKNSIELKDIIGDPDKVFASITKGTLGIDLLTIMFDAQDLTLKRMVSPLVSTLVGAYHYVLVDLPNDMDDFVLETLTQSDMIHLLSMDRIKDLEMTKKVLSKLEETLKENFNGEKVKVIIRSERDQIYLSFEEINKTIDFEVFTRLPRILPEEIKGEMQTQGAVIHQCDPHSEYMQVVTRVARQIGGVMVGLVLGGGAALGIAHVGVIKVLEEEKIPVDVVIGSSMGALIASLWAVGKNAKQLEVIAHEFENPKDMWQLFDPIIFPVAGVIVSFLGVIVGSFIGSELGGFFGTIVGAVLGALICLVLSARIFPTAGMIGDKGIVNWLRRHLGNSTFYGCQIPFKAVAYDLVRREELVISSGSLVDAVRKSIAIPGVLEPIKENGRLIIDGGVLNPLPTNVLGRMGIKKIIAVNVLQSPEHVSLGQDMADHILAERRKVSFKESPGRFIKFHIAQYFAAILSPNIPDIIVRTLQATEYVIAEQSAHQADVVIHPDLVGINWFELYRVNDLLKSGENATRKVLPEIKKLVTVETPTV